MGVAAVFHAQRRFVIAVVKRDVNTDVPEAAKNRVLRSVGKRVGFPESALGGEVPAHCGTQTFAEFYSPPGNGPFYPVHGIRVIGENQGFQKIAFGYNGKYAIFFFHVSPPYPLFYTVLYLYYKVS
jgi:hypothetical protein